MTIENSRAAIRVCAIADIQCTRGCGTGACKRETTTENSRADALTYETVDALSRKIGLRIEDYDHTEGNDLLDFARACAAASPAEQPAAAPIDWPHTANEWADAACNAVVWLKNIRDGLSTPADALAEMESNIARIRSESNLHQAAPAPADERAAPPTDGYFVYDPAGPHVEFYDTDAERDAAHRDAINEYRREATHDQEWSTEVVGIVSGIVTHTTAELKVDEDSYDYEPRVVPSQARAASASETGGGRGGRIY